MIKDIFSGLFTQASERIRNPLLGPFTGAWLVANWKPIAILFASETTIENRISVINENYLNLSTLLIAPLTFALFYALAIPWINFGLQRIQESANLRRKVHKLGIDTTYLEASVGRAEAQAALNKILAVDQITQAQKDEIDVLKKQLTDQEEVANSQIAATRAELEQRQKEYEKLRRKNQAADQERQKIEQLQTQLENERKQAQDESKKLRAALMERQADLESRLENQDRNFPTATTLDKKGLVSHVYKLFHNPGVGPERSKLITFLETGKVGMGSNNNEHSWRIVDGKLELIQADGNVHSRFHYLPESNIFVHTGDSDTKSARGQFIIPEEN